MKIALVHDSLAEFGGAERMMQSFLRLFPSADVFTSFYDKHVLEEFFPGLSMKKLHPSWAQGTPLMSRGSLFQCFSPLVWRTFNFDTYDVVISNSAYFLSNTVFTDKTLHIQYIQSVPKNIFGQLPKSPFQKIIPYSGYIAKLYKKSLGKNILVNSRNVQVTLNKLFGIQSIVLYPPVKTSFGVIIKRNPTYFVVVSRLDSTKGIELAIQACNHLGYSLKIVGKSNDDAYEAYLRGIAGKNVEFLGLLSDEEIVKVYQYAKAFLFTARNEDFGIAPLEALAAGVPVVSFYGGGPKETLVDGQTGVFFYNYDWQSLAQALERLSSFSFDVPALYAHARRFSEARFHRKFVRYMKERLGRK